MTRSKQYLIFFSSLLIFLIIISCNNGETKEKSKYVIVDKGASNIQTKYKFCKMKSSNNNTILQGAYYRENDTIFYIPVTRIEQILPPKVFSRLLHYPILPINAFDKSEFELVGKTSGNKSITSDKYSCKILDISICETQKSALDTIYIFENFIDLIELAKINEDDPSIENMYSDKRLSVFKAVYIFSTLRGLIYFDYLQDKEPILPYLPYIKISS